MPESSAKAAGTASIDLTAEEVRAITELRSE